MQHAELISALERIVGKQGVVSRSDELLVYEYDGSLDTHLPAVVVFPETTAQVAEIVKLANLAGAGTAIRKL